MNWPVAALLLYLALAVELGVRGSLTIAGSAAPSVVMALVVCVAAYAPLVPLLWFAFIAGLLLDVTTPFAPIGAGESIVIIGPRALGFLAAGALVYVLRGFLFVRNSVTITVLGITVAAAAAIVGQLLLEARSITDPEVVLARPTLIGVLLSSLYTGFPTLLLAMVWRWIMPWLGLHDPTQRRSDRIVIQR
jgi:cell shape-determining protein MreD